MCQFGDRKKKRKACGEEASPYEARRRIEGEKKGNSCCCGRHRSRISSFLPLFSGDRGELIKGKGTLCKRKD